MRRFEITKEMIPCPINGTDLAFEIFEDIFDRGEYVEHGNVYLGFVEGYACQFVHRPCTNVISVSGMSGASKFNVENRLVAVLKELDACGNDDEYRHVTVTHYKNNDVYIFYEKRV